MAHPEVLRTVSRRRVWTCRKCRAQWPRTITNCRTDGCTGRKPRAQPNSSTTALAIPYEDYVRLNGGEHCGICGRVPDFGRKLHRDHDHRTAEPRGVLCFQCNHRLRVGITLGWLRLAVRYLERTAA